MNLTSQRGIRTTEFWLNVMAYLMAFTMFILVLAVTCLAIVLPYHYGKEPSGSVVAAVCGTIGSLAAIIGAVKMWSATHYGDNRTECKCPEEGRA